MTSPNGDGSPVASPSGGHGKEGQRKPKGLNKKELDEMHRTSARLARGMEAHVPRAEVKRMSITDIFSKFQMPGGDSSRDKQSSPAAEKSPLSDPIECDSEQPFAFVSDGSNAIVDSGGKSKSLVVGTSSRKTSRARPDVTGLTHEEVSAAALRRAQLQSADIRAKKEKEFGIRHSLKKEDEGGKGKEHERGEGEEGEKKGGDNQDEDVDDGDDNDDEDFALSGEDDNEDDDDPVLDAEEAGKERDDEEKRGDGSHVLREENDGDKDDEGEREEDEDEQEHIRARRKRQGARKLRLEDSDNEEGGREDGEEDVRDEAEKGDGSGKGQREGEDDTEKGRDEAEDDEDGQNVAPDNVSPSDQGFTQFFNDSGSQPGLVMGPAASAMGFSPLCDANGTQHLLPTPSVLPSLRISTPEREVNDREIDAVQAQRLRDQPGSAPRQYINKDGLFTQTRPSQLFDSQNDSQPQDVGPASPELSPSLPTPPIETPALPSPSSRRRLKRLVRHNGDFERQGDQLIADGFEPSPTQLDDGRGREDGDDDIGDQDESSTVPTTRSPRDTYIPSPTQLDDGGEKEDDDDEAGNEAEGSTSPTVRSSRDAYAVLMQGRQSPEVNSDDELSAGQQKKKKRSKFIDARAEESDEDGILGGYSRGLHSGSDEDSDIDEEDDGSVVEDLIGEDDDDEEERARKDALARERYQEDVTKDDAANQKLHQDAVAGRLRKKRREGDMGDFLEFDELEDEFGRKRYRRIIAKKRRLDGGDDLDGLLSREDTKAFAEHYSETHKVEDPDEKYGFLQMDAEGQGEQEEVRKTVSAEKLRREIQERAKARARARPVVSDDEEDDELEIVPDSSPTEGALSLTLDVEVRSTTFVRNRRTADFSARSNSLPNGRMAFQAANVNDADEDDLKEPYRGYKAKPRSEKERERLAQYALEEGQNSRGGTSGRAGKHSSVTGFSAAKRPATSTTTTRTSGRKSGSTVARQASQASALTSGKVQSRLANLITRDERFVEHSV